MGISRERFDRLKTRFLSDELTDEEYLELRQLIQSQGSFKRELIAELHAYERLDRKLKNIIAGLNALLQ
ncbi:MAG TPA: hypothetical protein EYQ50_00090 [Verrucomicrobiales bacterium]|nr:hypothetical protein [Verrucomicrobiales bacterium]